MKIKPGPKPDAAQIHRREALRFCMAGVDEGWSLERTSELCLEVYDVVIPAGVIRDVYAVLKQFAASRAIKEPELRVINDLGVALQ